MKPILFTLVAMALLGLLAYTNPTLDNRDRGKPHGFAPPTPPGIRVRTMAVRYS